MKLIIREYLASLREREELDAILPDLLSDLGFNVYSRPQRGTLQHGVDFAAVGRLADEEEKLYLFSVKKGDLTRQEWDGTPQALRPSLNEIIDSYIPTRIPPEYSHLKIVICLCFGGEIREQVRSAVVGYMRQNTTERISYEEWNGEKIAGFLLDGILREDLLPKQLRSRFQKAVAMLDEPDIAYRHFSHLLNDLRLLANESDQARVRVSRQIYICLWVIFVWGRDIDNLEAPYLASELSLLTTWELIKPTLGEETKASSDIVVVLNELIQVHMSIASTLLSKLLPFVTIPDGLSSAVMSPTSVDANLKLFDILGRIAIHGLWLKWHGEAIANDQPATSAFHEQALKQIQALCGNGFDAIRNNGCLRLPIADHVATDVALFLLLWLASESDEGELRPWLTSLVERLEFTLATRGRYPTSFDDYRDLIEHPRDSGDEYFRKATAGSTLIPLVAAWLTGLGESELVARISTLVGDKLKHCTIQLWTPDTSSEEHMYVNSENHGRAITDIPIDKSGTELLRTISDACGGDAGFNSLTAAKYGFWPLVMVACRHWRFPIPPDFWIGALQSGRPEESSGANAPNPESPEL